MDYSGSLTLDWINKDKSLYYEIDPSENRGIRPVWVDKDDIRVTEPRPLILKGTYGEKDTENMLIRGDNLLALRRLVHNFKERDEKDKVKCIYIDPPYNTKNAFEHYDDNLKHSEWLTMMRDRMILLRELLRKDGVIFIQLNTDELFHFKAMTDEIFGRINYLNMFTVKTSDPSGHRTVNPSPYTSAEFILMYAKDKKEYEYETYYVPCDHDYSYNRYITNIENHYENWNIESLNDIVAQSLGYKTVAEAQEAKGKLDFLEIVKNFAINNSHAVFQPTAISNKAGKSIVELRDKSADNPGKIYCYKRNEKEDIYILNGRQIYFYSNKVKLINGKLTPTMPLTNIWMDVAWNGIAREGSVQLKQSKKPERLVQRILDFTTQENELILDAFAGSGTTAAVAHKMKRRWITIEVGQHAEDLCLERLKSVIDTESPDTTGISKDVNWGGGGGFKYYEVGPSVIDNDDLNWSLDNKELATTIVEYFGYTTVERRNNVVIGIQEQRTTKKIAICTISKEIEVIEETEFNKLIEYTRSKYKFSEIVFFTNKGIEVEADELDGGIIIKKLPDCIFS